MREIFITDEYENYFNDIDEAFVCSLEETNNCCQLIASKNF